MRQILHFLGGEGAGMDAEGFDGTEEGVVFNVRVMDLEVSEMALMNKPGPRLANRAWNQGSRPAINDGGGEGEEHRCRREERRWVRG